LQESNFKTFSMRWNLFLLCSLTYFSCFSQDPYLFIGTYTSGPSKGIYVYRFHTASGTGTEVSTVKASNPSYLSISPDGKHLYAASEGEKGGSALSYAFEPATGQLSFLNEQSSMGTCTCYIAEDKTGRWVFAANYCSGNLVGFPVNTDGSLAPVIQNIQQFGKGPDTARQESSHLHSTIFSPDEKFLLAANLGTDQEHIYSFDPTREIPLREPYDSMVVLKPGSGPRHIAFNPKRPDVYILSELSGTVDGYHFDAVSGKLRHFQRIRTTPISFTGDPGSADIHIGADGKFLYASNRGSSNTIAVFAIHNDGKLISRQIVSVKGKHPRNFVIDPTGHFLLVANRDTNNIVIFSIDPGNGQLKATGNEISIPSPVCLKFLAN
jgi:6-phosphogluconolactonase